MLKTSILIALALAACAVDVDTDIDTQEVITPITLSSTQFTNARAAASAIRTSALNSNSASIQALVATADGRAMFTAIVGCALPAGQSVVANGLTYNGAIGVASQWKTAVPTTASQRWTTACVLARTSSVGLAVNVSVRHDSFAPLLAGGAEIASYPTSVGGFYGNIFQAAPVNYACGTVAWPAGNTLTDCARTVNGVTTVCGFTWTGLCPAVAGPCVDKTAPYAGCTGAATTYAEVASLFIP